MSTWTDVRDAIEKVAPALLPVLGGVAGGPLGAAAGELMGKALGTDGSSPDAVLQAVTDPAAYAKLQALQIGLEQARIQAEQARDTSQVQVNQAEAGNQSLFVAGWRPGIGWVCAAAFGYAYILQPFGAFAAALAGYHGQLPQVDISGMMPVLLGLLGLGGMRTLEKVKGVSSGH